MNKFKVGDRVVLRSPITSSNAQKGKLVGRQAVIKSIEKYDTKIEWGQRYHIDIDTDYYWFDNEMVLAGFLPDELFEL